MHYEENIIECCGLNGLYMLPVNVDSFIKQIKGMFDGDKVHGAFVIATTSHNQRHQEAYLKELGFRKVGRQLNTNSGNMVSVWIISRAKFNRTILGNKR